jgi:hypothetical protein
MSMRDVFVLPALVLTTALRLVAQERTAAMLPSEARLKPIASHTTAAVVTPVSFRRHVIPVLTKMGCNSGACHGAAAGKNGFALTLRGYDPDADYDTITRHAGGRRVNKVEPAKSLLLLKPTETLPHMGGKRFEVGSVEYSVLARWIASGLRPPAATDPTLVGLTVTPAAETLHIGDSRQLRVEARWSDATTDDVTRYARYGSADESVVGVDEHGRVTVRGFGETAVTVGFMTQVALARVSSPFTQAIPEEVFDRAEQYGSLDRHVLQKLRQLRIRPAGLCSDAEFVRRAYLDAAGILPTRPEVEQFLADTARDKRARLVDTLLARPEFVDYWAYKWSDLLLVSSRALDKGNVQAFYGWIRTSVERNTPWDRFVRDLTTASGRTDQVGAANYFVIHPNPIDLAENYTQAFLGLTLTCARCHNHPMEKWTQREYYAFANLFARVSIKEDERAFLGKANPMLVSTAPEGELLHPRLGVALPPRPLDGTPMPAHSSVDRRVYLAEWLTSPTNTQFARTVVNRVWANVLGRGIVHPMDDLRATNPASNEELLASLAADFVSHGFDVKWLIRTIMTSATYQRSSDTDETNAKDERYFSHYLTRRLPAEVILDAFSQVTGVPESFPGYPAGTRALQLPDTRIDSYFLTVFGRPERLITSAAERQMDPSLPQALHAINGGTLNRKLMDDSSTIARAAAASRSNSDVLDDLYLSALSRHPSSAERTAILARLSETSGDTRRTLEDLAWAVMTSREFLFNH